MGITVGPGEYFTAEISGLATGLYGTLTLGVYDTDEVVVITAPSVYGIVENPATDYSGQRVSPVTAGNYKVVWNDGTTSYSEELTVEFTGTLAPYLPSVEDVALWIRARTKDSQGNEVGTFTANTRPTNEDVERLILLIAAGYPQCAGEWLPSSLFIKSRFALSLRVAAAIEISFFPEQLDPRQSAYEYLIVWANEELERLCALAENFLPTDGSVPMVVGDLPTFYFGDGPGIFWVNSQWRPDLDKTLYHLSEALVVGQWS